MTMIEDAATEPFEDFVNNCLFIHDDPQDPTLEVDSDQHGTKPFLLGARFCVTDGLQGFGEAYRNYLRELRCFPENLFVTTPRAESLIANLLSDTNTFSLVKDIVIDQKLDISTFYSGKEEQELVNLISSHNFSPRLHPSHDIFEQANDKFVMRKLLDHAGLPIPIGEICLSAFELKRFCTFYRKVFTHVVIKRQHWDTVVYKADELASNSYRNLKFPLIVEGKYNNCSSPICHHIVWQNRPTYLFTVWQQIETFLHFGNFIPFRPSDDVNQRIRELSTYVIDLLPGHSGIIGVDFLVTSTNDILIVDVNPRFNSSTYPFQFMKRMGLDLENTFAHTGHMRCNLANLDQLYLHSGFAAFSPSRKYGIILFAPIFDFQRSKITHLSYLCIAQNHQGLVQLRDGLNRLVYQLNENA